MTLVISDLTSAKLMTELSTCQSKHVCGGTSPWNFGFDFGVSWNRTDVTNESVTVNAIGPGSVVVHGTDNANINVTLGGG